MYETTLGGLLIAHNAVRRGVARGRFLKMLDRGLLDEAIRAYIDHPASGRRLPARPHVERAGLYDAMHMRPALLPPERPLVSPGATA